MESSRVFVRGLPPKYTDADVRKHFAAFPVTDLKWIPHRRIAFIGYRSSEDALKAVKHFNKSFVGMAKIHVEIAKSFTDQDLPTSRRQRKAEQRAPRDDFIPLPKENALKRKRDEAEQDPKLKEFLDVMQPPSKTKVWANEGAQLGPTTALAVQPVEEVAVPDGETDDEYQDITKKAKTAQRQPAPEARPSANTPEKQTEADEEKDEEHGVEEHAEAAAEDQGPVSDADWLRSRTNRVLDLVEDDDPPGQDPKVDEEMEDAPNVVEAPLEAPKTADRKAADSAPSEEDKIRQTGRLYLRNLHYEVTEDDIRERFDKYGSLEEVHIPQKKADGKGKGFAFLQYGEPEHAVEAFSQNDGTIFQGRLLHIIPATSKRETMDDYEISKLPLKKQREVRRKMEAGKATFNWNSLYLNADAVMSTVADRMGITKGELLDPSSSDAAVKQALAETHLIQETKAYFASHGVDLEAFKRSSRGDTALLVKNLPASTIPGEVRKLFEEHGTIKRFIMPPTGLTAIVEFDNSTQAKSALSSLAYRKIQGSILYLEKAPKDLFSGQPTIALQTAAPTKPGAKISAQDLLEESTAESTSTATLHVKNLNFSTTTAKLNETFAPLAGFRSAVVRTKVDPKRGVLSMGFGFLEFDGAEAADAALKAMQGYMLEGHSLKIQASRKGAEERGNADAAKKAAGTKILIKNLPFEATKKDVRALFSPYGTLRSVRVPRKFDSKSRGFAFAEFATQRDASNAMNALSNTHLLGRRLVLSFAESESEDPEKELEKMQQKVGSQANKVALQKLTSGGRKKFNVAGTDDLDEA